MRFLISRPDDVMSIDNVAISLDCSSLDPSVKYVLWNENGSGFIEPATGIALRTSFTDPSPYQPLVNAWITAQAAATPALTPAQARAIKSELVDALWIVKRQAPVSVLTSLGTFSFDANDFLGGALNIASWMPAVADIILQVNTTNAHIASLATAFDTALATYAAAVNSSISGLDTSLSTYNGALDTAMANLVAAINAYTGTLATQLNADWAFLVADSFAIPQPTQSASALSWSNLTAPSESGSIAAPSASYSQPSDLPATLSSAIKMLPVGATAFPAFTLADMFLVLNAVTGQRNNELIVRNTKQVAIAALATVADCIAYDATTGW